MIFEVGTALVFVGSHFGSYYEIKKESSSITILEIGLEDIYLFGLRKIPILGNIL